MIMLLTMIWTSRADTTTTHDDDHTMTTYDDRETSARINAYSSDRMLLLLSCHAHNYGDPSCPHFTCKWSVCCAPIILLHANNGSIMTAIYIYIYIYICSFAHSVRAIPHSLILSVCESATVAACIGTSWRHISTVDADIIRRDVVRRSDRS